MDTTYTLCYTATLLNGERETDAMQRGTLEELKALAAAVTADPVSMNCRAITFWITDADSNTVWES